MRRLCGYLSRIEEDREEAINLARENLLSISIELIRDEWSILLGVS